MALVMPLFWAKMDGDASHPDSRRDFRRTMSKRFMSKRSIFKRCTIFFGFLALSTILAVACGTTEQPGPGGSQESGGGMAGTETAMVDHPTAAADATAMQEPSAAAGGVTAESTDTTTVVAARSTTAPDTAAVITPTEVTLAEAAPTASLPPVGAGVGELAPSYSLTLFDGSTVSSEDLTKAGKPVFLFFTATW